MNSKPQFVQQESWIEPSSESNQGPELDTQPTRSPQAPGPQSWGVDGRDRLWGDRTLSQWLKPLVESISEGVILKDERGCWLLANEVALRLFQLIGIEYAGKTNPQLSQDSPIAQAILTADAESEQTAWELSKTIYHRVEFPTPSGELRSVDIKKTPLFNSDGTRQGTIAVVWEPDLNDRLQVEESSRGNPGKQKATMETIPDVMLYLKADGTILDCKNVPEQTTAIPPNFEIGLSIYEIWPLSIATEGMKYILQALETGEVQTWEYELTINGNCYSREARIMACAEDRVVAILRDITERKQAEAALEYVAQAVESASDAIAISDANGNHIYHNLAFSTLFEYGTVEELKAAGGPSILYTDPEVAREIFEAIAPGQSWIGSVEQRTRSGKIVQVLLRADGIKDPTGKIIGRIGISTNLTPQIQVEAALQQSKQKLSLHLEQTPLAVVEFNLNGEIVEWNPAAEAIFGYSKAEILGRGMALLFPATEGQDAGQRWLDLLDQKGGACSICENVRKDGQRTVCEWYTTPLIDREGETIAVASLAQDITERVRAEEAMRHQSDRERLVSRTLARIRQSLNLEEILNTAVSEVRQFLDCDRVVVYQILPDQSGRVVTESVIPPWPSMLGQSFGEEIFPPSCYERYCNGTVKAIDDLKAANSPQCLIEFLQPFGVNGKMIAPLLHENRLWGLLVAHQCNGIHHWQPFEIRGFEQLSTQLAIAIQQSTLFKQLEAANEELQRIASLDGLTQVANRRAFDECLHREWRRTIREHSMLSLILCDIDFFKLYNDTYGHQAGDTCLKQVAQAIASAAKRPADLVARYGGEEFAVILPHTNGEGAMQVAQTIRNQVKALRIHHAKSPVGYVSISLGVAVTLPRPQDSVEKLIRSADRALYEAKSLGRDRAVLEKYSASL
jgi:diguanylate cyclase (GGDEF)-like protein/PAS domain S-box-containing protein